MIKLSVIIPVYNVEAYLAKCLDSVLTDSDAYEILLINDGSTDSSLAIAEQYQQAHPSLIHVITTENGGLGSARNVGIEHARGEYLYFLDSDDYLIPGAINAIIDSLSMGYDLCLFDSISVDPSGRELGYIKGCDRTAPLDLQHFPALLLQSPNAWNKIYHRRLFLDTGVRFPPRIWFEDLCTVLKLYTFTDNIVYIPQAWHRYLQRPGSILNSGKAERNREIILSLNDLLDFYRSRGLYDVYRTELEYLSFYCEFLTSSVRANTADWKSPVQEELLLDFLSKFPDYRQNPYVKSMPRKHKLLTFLLMHRMRRSVHLIMRLNNLIKRK